MTPLAPTAAPTASATTMLAAACAAALALCLPAVQLSHVDDTGPLPVVERAPIALPCQVERGDGAHHGSVVHLGNDTAGELPRGARIAWATTGTPASQGHWHWLAQPLAPGRGLSIALSVRLHGSGCVATLLH